MTKKPTSALFDTFFAITAVVLLKNKPFLFNFNCCVVYKKKLPLHIYYLQEGVYSV